MYHLFEIYPECKNKEDRTPYFIEFLQFFKDDPITWKIYKRNFLQFEGTPPDFMCNEGHPWWLLDGKLQPDGTVPDKKYLKWMVDAFNEKAEKELTSPPN